MATFKLAVQIVGGKKLAFNVRPSTTLDDLKGLINGKQGIAASSQYFVLNDELLPGSNVTLSSCNVQPNSTLYLLVLDEPPLPVPEPNTIELFVRVSGATRSIHVPPNASIKHLKEVVAELTTMTPDEVGFIYNGRSFDYDKTLADYNIKEGALIHLYRRLRGGKPVVLFYPPTTGVHAGKPVSSVVTVALHTACCFTTLLPRPTTTSTDGQTITWEALVAPASSHADSSSEWVSADVEAAGRKHSYLFWEFENKTGAAAEAAEEVSRTVGVDSLAAHPDSTFLVDAVRFGDWCHDVLGGLLGLGVRECDDFATFWAGRVLGAAGSLLVARVVPEAELARVARLDVSATSDAGSVPVLVRRVYVTMLVCQKLPAVLEQHQHRFLRTTTELPAELRSTFPLVRRTDALTVVEWGGILLSL